MKSCTIRNEGDRVRLFKPPKCTVWHGTIMVRIQTLMPHHYTAGILPHQARKLAAALNQMADEIEGVEPR